MIIPSLSMAERDYVRDEIDDREQAFINRVILDVLNNLDGEPENDLVSMSAAATTPAPVPKGGLDGKMNDGDPFKILALPAHDSYDVLVLKMLNLLTQPVGLTLNPVEEVLPALKVVERVTAENPSLVLISHLPPDGLTVARYLVKRIRAVHPRLPIVVCRWGEVKESSTSAQRLTSVGATQVFSTLAEARDYLVGLAQTKSGKPETTSSKLKVSKA